MERTRFNKCFLEACLRFYNDTDEIDELLRNTRWTERGKIKKDVEYLKTLNTYHMEHPTEEVDYVPFMYFIRSAEIMKEIICYMRDILPCEKIDVESDDRR